MMQRCSRTDMQRLLRLVHCQLVTCALLLAGLVAMGWSAPQKASAEGNAYIVTILGAAQPPGYAPALLTVHVYDTVVFLNKAVPAASYAVIADDGDFSSPAIAPGKQWGVTFSSPGAFEYQESTTNAHMAGVIVVAPAIVPLLASPAPAAQATAISLIEAGKMPPDTLWQAPPKPTPRTISRQVSKTTAAAALFASPGMFALVFAASAAAVIVLELLVFVLVKWSKPAFRQVVVRVQSIRARREEEDDE